MKPASSDTPGSVPRSAIWVGWTPLGIGALVLAGLVSVQLSVQHALGIGLPGCGAGSPCARAAAGRWGSVPGLGWPVSYVGAVFFFGVAAAWIADRAGPGWLVRALARLGCAGSVFFLVISVGERIWCPYCLTVHAANLLAWFACERASGKQGHGSSRRAGLAFVACATVVGAAAALGDRAAHRAAARSAELDLSATVQSLKDGGAAPVFQGRYLIGPEGAPVRIVVFTDYQCPDCRLLESGLERLLSSRKDVSLSVKHFPFCTSCNPRAGRDLHPNACRAALAAEAAGSVGGGAGFAKMHRWLFERAGEFSEAQLRAAAPTLGLDSERLISAMGSPAVAAAVTADIDEAFAVGLNTTPMVFINGVELRGWSAPDALARAADAAATTPARPGDRPAGALARLVDDWLAQPKSSIPPAAHPWVRGSEKPSVRVVVFGDYQEPNCADADRVIRDLIARRTDTSYEFRHFPLNSECNPAAQVNKHPIACRMARAAEVAGAAGGAPAFWAMHEWLFANQRKFTDHGVLGVLRPLGIEIASLARASEAPEISGRILGDCRSAEAVGITGVPLIFVNDQRVPQWTYADLKVLDAIVERAAQGH